MFPRRERLPRTSFPAAMRGRRLVSPHFTIIIPTETRGYAVVVPKKVVRGSVARHLAKRQIHEVLRTITLPSSLIVLVRAPLAGMQYQQIVAELAGLFLGNRS